MELNFLAANYNQLCRETGDIADTFRAEQLARRSLKVRTYNNDPAYYALALSLFTQHRFRESVAMGRRMAARSRTIRRRLISCREPDRVGRLRGSREDPAGRASPPRRSFGMVLRARLLEMNGQAGAALQLERARDAAAQNIDIPRENLAWFCMRVGDCRRRRDGRTGGARVIGRRWTLSRTISAP